MTEQEVNELMKELERKEANNEELTVCELTILDIHNGLKKKGKEISERIIEEVRFWMD